MKATLVILFASIVVLGASVHAEQISRTLEANAPSATDVSRQEDAREGNTKPDGKSDFDTYKIVIERNIFNPNRRKKTVEAATAKPPQRERIELLGAVIDNQGTVALFDGTKREYQVARKPGDTIEGFRVVDVRTDGVKLEKDGQRVEMPIGSQLTREGEAGPWKMALASASGSVASGHEGNESGAKPDSGSAKDSSAKAASSGSSGDSLLQKLMERRKKELGQ